MISKNIYYYLVLYTFQVSNLLLLYLLCWILSQNFWKSYILCLTKAQINLTMYKSFIIYLEVDQYCGKWPELFLSMQISFLLFLNYIFNLPPSIKIHNLIHISACKSKMQQKWNYYISLLTRTKKKNKKIFLNTEKLKGNIFKSWK